MTNRYQVLANCGVNSRHLDPESLEDRRAAYARHPAHVLVMDGFLEPSVAQRLSDFLTHEGRFRRHWGLRYPEGNVEESAWLRADGADRLYRFEKLDGIREGIGLTPSIAEFLRFRSLIARQEFLSFFCALTGAPISGSTELYGHAFRQGDFLGEHDDKSPNRKLAVVYYLTHNWRPEYGGSLIVYDHRRSVERIPPLHNRLAIMDVLSDSRHEVESLSPVAEDWVRLSLGWWFK